VSVDNRYTGVGYEPPFETPSDNDFMAAHIESLNERIEVLEDSLREMIQAFVDYEMEVDIEPHHEHIKMMRKARAALEVKP
jgi:hypothetical protein